MCKRQIRSKEPQNPGYHNVFILMLNIKMKSNPETKRESSESSCVVHCLLCALPVPQYIEHHNKRVEVAIREAHREHV